MRDASSSRPLWLALLAVLAALATPAAVGTTTVSAQAPRLLDVLTSVGDRVRQYYGRAQSVMCNEKVTIQPINRGFSPEGFARVLEYDLRIEWEANVDGDSAPDARVVRELRRVNGRPPRARDFEACMDPKSVSPEPLELLLPQHRDEYLFSWMGPGKLKNQRTVMLDYRSRVRGKIEGSLKDDCVSISAPGYSKGRIWVDEATHDVLRIDEQLVSRLEYRLPRGKGSRYAGSEDTYIVERADSTIRYRRVAFHDPEETVLVPESIESLTVFGGSAASHRTTQVFSEYRRFLTTGRIVK
ncbi:MAG: hypothetical protein HY048_15455 [Acidobacteria bacterium]|nr:hypothetical protein [Acidobacteriota bacterium]